MSAPSSPAFPAAPNSNWTDDAEFGQRGMTMRQYYKAAALPLLMANRVVAEEIAAYSLKSGKSMEAYVSRLAAQFADAMIAEDEEHARK